MALYTIADLHLPGGTGDAKKMDVFDPVWTDAQNKLEKNWRALVTDGDAVVLPGDFSWALKLEDTIDDFRFLDALPGQKYIGKGNHDFWWTTAKTMNGFFAQNGFSSLHLLYNNSYELPEAVIVGARGWFPDPANQKAENEADWQKVSAREEIRLDISLRSVPADVPPEKERILFMHFPPVWNGLVLRGILDKMHASGIRRCYFGHIHGYYLPDADFDFEGIRFEMVSADHLHFIPKRVFFA